LTREANGFLFRNFVTEIEEHEVPQLPKEVATKSFPYNPTAARMIRANYSGR
jgi:hypothetical protein